MTCPRCGGTGRRQLSESLPPVRCEACHGTGHIDTVKRRLDRAFWWIALVCLVLLAIPFACWLAEHHK